MQRTFQPSPPRSQDETIHSSSRTSITLPAANAVLAVITCVSSLTRAGKARASDTAG
jgi:hypothetical protein